MDDIVYKLSGSQASPSSIFMQKTWNAITDNNISSYGSNVATISTDFLTNNSGFANWQEAYFHMPLLYTLTCPQGSTTSFLPNTDGSSADYALGLKNWFGHILHSMQVDIGGVTILQGIPYQSLWNVFKLNMTLSWDSIYMWSSIGFYPDNSQSIAFSKASGTTVDGIYSTTVNNMNAVVFDTVTGVFNNGSQANAGFEKRQTYWNLNPKGYTSLTGTSLQFSSLISTASLQSAYKSYIFNTANVTATSAGVFQACINATIYLSHLHDFFNNVPMCKGLYMTFRLTLNNSSVTFATSSTNGQYSTCSVQVANSGVSPVMLASGLASSGASLCLIGTQTGYIASISVGATCHNQTQVGYGTSVVQTSPYKAIQLWIPTYFFTPQYETAYTSGENMLREFVFEDVQFNSTQNIVAGGNVNGFTISNSVANAKSVLLLPYYTATANGGILPIQSPFDSAGSTTSPFAYLSNIILSQSGKNITQTPLTRVGEAYLNYVQGQRAVNGGQIDGITSGLISQQDFETCYLYYYQDVSRMLDTDKSVAKRYDVSFTNASAKDLDVYCFVSFYRTFRLNVVTGATF